MTIRYTLAISDKRRAQTALVAAIVLFAAFCVGLNPSIVYILLPLAVVAMLAILRYPRLGLLAVIAAALAVPLPIRTGTEVALYPVVLVIPALGALWMLHGMLHKRMFFPVSSIHLPLGLFLAAGLLSLGIGNLIWDPLVPRKDNFILVQVAQWALFAFSAGALWLTAILANHEKWLQRMTVVFLVFGGGFALLRVSPPAQAFFFQISTGAVDRAPFWLLLVALAGGQLLYNRRLQNPVRFALAGLICVAIYFSFFLERQAAAYWVGIAVAMGVLVWLRFPRLRIPVAVLAIVMLSTGVLTSTVWDFAGGDSEWNESGASRLTLIQRVVEVTMRNPVTGLGPAAYRGYANMKPLPYGRALWLTPQINSHNNYVDLFSFTGIVGLGLFLWFLVAISQLAWRLHSRYEYGFVAGYVNSMLATLAAVMVLMFLLDWFLPSVYNVGFLGFQASVLIWLFLGGLVAIDQWSVPSAAL